jgi:hypothetical protein
MGGGGTAESIAGVGGETHTLELTTLERPLLLRRLDVKLDPSDTEGASTTVLGTNACFLDTVVTRSLRVLERRGATDCLRGGSIGISKRRVCARRSLRRRSASLRDKRYRRMAIWMRVQERSWRNTQYRRRPSLPLYRRWHMDARVCVRR